MSTAGLLTARPIAGRAAGDRRGAAGRQRIAVVGPRSAWLAVGPHVDLGKPAPLAVMLHGAGGAPEHGLLLLEPFASEAGWIALAPASTSYTWDVLVSGIGPDVAQIDIALRWVFERYDIAPERIAIGGFSDGASYALTLGIANGGLFRDILALSPGFAAAATARGKPRIFVSHGTHDTVLPIASCSRRIVPQLKRGGYAVDYHEFPGGHVIPAEIARRAVAWAANPTR
jgi:phospholipase/carboxylesterase